MITHKCSYYCNPPIHAEETVAAPDVTEEDMLEHFKMYTVDPDNIYIRRLNEVDDDFYSRAMQDNPIIRSYIPYLVIYRWSDEDNETILKAQNDTSSI